MKPQFIEHLHWSNLSYFNFRIVQSTESALNRVVGSLNNDLLFFLNVLSFPMTHPGDLCDLSSICKSEALAVGEEGVAELIFDEVTHKHFELNSVWARKELDKYWDLDFELLDTLSSNVKAIKRMTNLLVVLCSVLQAIFLAPVISLVWELIPVVHLCGVRWVVIENSDHLSTSCRTGNEPLDDRAVLNAYSHLVSEAIPVKDILLIVERIVRPLMLDCAWKP